MSIINLEGRALIDDSRLLKIFISLKFIEKVKNTYEQEQDKYTMKRKV